MKYLDRYTKYELEKGKLKVVRTFRKGRIYCLSDGITFKIYFEKDVLPNDYIPKYLEFIEEEKENILSSENRLNRVYFEVNSIEDMKKIYRTFLKKMKS